MQASANATPSDLPKIEFEPHSDTVFIQVDWVERSQFDIDEDPAMIPSGIVIAVGPGKLLNNGQRIPPPFEPGDHIMVSSGSMCLLPIRERPDDIVAVVHEEHILGKMKNAVKGSIWFIGETERSARRRKWDGEQKDMRKKAAQEAAAALADQRRKDREEPGPLKP